MNPSLLGAAAATLLVAFWLVSRRKPRPFLRSDDTSAVAALNRAQRERLLEPPSPAPAAPDRVAAVPAAAVLSALSAPPRPAASAPSAPAPGFPADSSGWPVLPAAADGRGRRQLLARLSAAARGPLAERLEAVRLARRWRHRAALPLLRQALRDVHPAVVREAALALEAYRGRSAAASAVPPARASAPRRVARTR